MRLTAVTHARLRLVVAHWRGRQAENEAAIPLDPTGQREQMAKVYRQCANDLDLALRDDASVQPRGSR